MKCPLDGAELVAESYEADIQVDRCPDCGGVWLDAGELARVQETQERDYAAELATQPDLAGRAFDMAVQLAAPARACPACATTMDRREHAYCSQIIVDVCVACGGRWLDAGEIEALEVFFERSHVETPVIRGGFFASLGGAWTHRTA
jgi:Zn-finger nucleic acid-binding protein